MVRKTISNNYGSTLIQLPFRFPGTGGRVTIQLFTNLLDGPHVGFPPSIISSANLSLFSPLLEVDRSLVKMIDVNDAMIA